MYCLLYPAAPRPRASHSQCRCSRAPRESACVWPTCDWVWVVLVVGVEVAVAVATFAMPLLACACACEWCTRLFVPCYRPHPVVVGGSVAADLVAVVSYVVAVKKGHGWAGA